MAKRPIRNAPTKIRTESVTLAENTVNDLLNSVGLTTGTITVSGNSIKIKGTRNDNTRITVEKRTRDGYQEQYATQFTGSSVNERIDIAIRLRQEGLTQQDIADKIRVSQKTVSNYLKIK